MLEQIKEDKCPYTIKGEVEEKMGEHKQKMNIDQTFKGFEELLMKQIERYESRENKEKSDCYHLALSTLVSFRDSIKSKIEARIKKLEKENMKIENKQIKRGGGYHQEYKILYHNEGRIEELKEMLK